MRIGILSRGPKLYSTQRLVEAAKERGHEVRVVDYLRCYVEISSRKPAVLFQGTRFDDDAVSAGVAGTLRVMAALGIDGAEVPPGQAPVEARSSAWVRARRAGIFRLRVGLGAEVQKSSVLGEIGDTFAGRRSIVRAHAPGIVIGLNAHPLVNRGDALVHIAQPDEARNDG